MRQIKDAVNHSTGELVYIKGHAKATFMSDGSTVEDTINNIKIENTDNVATKSDLDLKQDIISDLDIIRLGASLGWTSVLASQLATIAISGDYNDLSNKPTIPSVVTESTVNEWGFTKNTGTYSKPSGGIPKTDLASAVQTSLGKADTALQSYTEQYKGTVTGVKINGSSKSPSNGIVDLGTVIIEHQDISHLATKAEIPTVPTKISDLTDDSNFITVKIIDDMDGLDIPSDIEIPKNNENPSSTGAYSLVNHGTSDTTFTLTPNTFHVWDEVTTLDLDFGTETEGVANEYLFLFTSGSTATTLILPSVIKWANDVIPVIELNSTYLISILNNCAVFTTFKAS